MLRPSPAIWPDGPAQCRDFRLARGARLATERAADAAIRAVKRREIEQRCAGFEIEWD